MSKNEIEYAVIDVETTPIKAGEQPETLFWGFADSGGYERFETTKEFLKFLKKYDERVLLHHANFDIIQLLVDGANLAINRSHDGRLIRCSIGKHDTINTYSVFPVSLAEIFKAYGYEKTGLEQDKGKMVKVSDASRELGYRLEFQSNLEKRNQDDCVIGLKCFLELDQLFTEICGVSPLKRGTIASTAFAAAQLSCGHKMPEDKRFLEAYRGGRTDAFRIGDCGLCHKYDINSSYPKSILDVPLHGILLEVWVECKDWFCPFFDAGEPDLLSFPNGEFKTWLFEENLKYIPTQYFTIKKLKRHPIDFSWLYSLREFVLMLYARKQSSTGAIRLVCKLLLNSLYGRLGLRGESERARILPGPIEREAINYRLGPHRWLVFDTVQREVKANYPFAAWVTDNARARLFEAIKKTEAIYCDTDSVVTKCPPDKFPLMQGAGLGEWKYEGYEPFTCSNVKDYLWGKEEHRKGGKEFLKWTLKQFARVGYAESVTRTRITSLRKRIVLPSGETYPVIAN